MAIEALGTEVVKGRQNRGSCPRRRANVLQRASEVRRLFLRSGLSLLSAAPTSILLAGLSARNEAQRDGGFSKESGWAERQEANNTHRKRARPFDKNKSKFAAHTKDARKSG